MNGMDDKMEELKINLNKLLHEMVTNGERVVKETHYENKINVNHDFIDSNIGLKTHHVPKIYMRKYDGKDPGTWILQMEQFFDLHNVQNTKGVCIATLYLEPNHFVWYRWLCSRKKIVTWAIFIEEMIAHYEDMKRNTFFSQLINLKQKGSMMQHVEDLQKLNIRVKNIPKEHRIDVFIGTLKDNIQHEVHLWEANSLEKAFKLARKMESKFMATKKPTTDNYKDGSVAATRLPQPTRFTPQQLEEKRAKEIFYSYDSKYTKSHKCAEKKLFYIDCKEEEEEEQEMSKEEDILQEKTLDKEEVNPTIYCNALAGITTPQTIKIEGHIKKKKVIVLIDSGSTHIFIHCKIAKELNCLLYPAPKCHVMVASRGTINFSRKCHNIKLSMGEYVLNSPMLSIPMGGVDVVLGVQWLQSLGTIAFNFQEIFMKFSTEGKEGSVPANIRPYRYPYAQKSEIERMVVEMIEAGIIQPSQSSFSAPIVLVNKKDGSWRMCPDYREINKLTIKDKFLIPVINELLDELHGSIYFTKLDLRSGYHQIIMKAKDILKTTFRTREAHYEFLVMHFGFTNAPSTFQGLMNSIFKPFLRKFV
eukprot:PITA_09546